jgi:hypothetical protein
MPRTTDETEEQLRLAIRGERSLRTNDLTARQAFGPRFGRLPNFLITVH